MAALAFEGGLLVPNIGLRLFCALRPEEVARIKWSDIDLDAGVIHIREEISKTRQVREVKLEPLRSRAHAAIPWRPRHPGPRPPAQC